MSVTIKHRGDIEVTAGNITVDNIPVALSTIVVQSDTPVTAQFSRRYLAVFATTEFNDPTPPQEGEFEVIVGNGLATVGGVQYSEGTRIVRRWHSGSWTSYVYTNETPLAVTVTSNISSSRNWSDRTLILNNDATARTITINGSLNVDGLKTNNGTITFVQGSGRTLVDVNGTAVLDGLVGSNFRIVSVGTTDYLWVNNV